MFQLSILLQNMKHYFCHRNSFSSARAHTHVIYISGVLTMDAKFFAWISSFPPRKECFLIDTIKIFILLINKLRLRVIKKLAHSIAIKIQTQAIWPQTPESSTCSYLWDKSSNPVECSSFISPNSRKIG